MTRRGGPAAGRVVLGIDLGTSAVKALVVDGESGRPIASASAGYATRSPAPGVAEQEPEDWRRATEDAVRHALRDAGPTARRVAAVGVAGQMHGLVATGADGGALVPCQTWADVRGAAEAAEIEATLGRARAVALAGSAPDPAFTAPKALWLRRHRPRVLAAARWLLLPKDWLRLQLTGEVATEPSDASGTALFDVTSRRWSPELCAAANVELRTLPPLLPSAGVAGAITTTAASSLGLPARTPVVAGAGDAPAAAVAARLVAGERRNALASLGTAGQIYVRLDRPIVEPNGRLHTLCHPDPDSWGLMAAILSAGSALQWLADTLVRPGASPLGLLRAANDAPVGADGLLFAPWLRGERSPYLDSEVRAAFAGLTLAHGREHLARAVLEGVAFAFRTGSDAMAALGAAPQSVVVAGRAAAGRLWRRVLADVLELPVARLHSHQGSALGAARLAAVGAGLSDERWSVATRDLVEPDPRTGDAYRDAYARYTALYASLRDL